MAPSPAPILAPALAVITALAWHGTARVQITIQNAHIRHVFLSFFLPAVGFPTEKYSRMEFWHYHLEATGNSEDMTEGDGGLSYYNIFNIVSSITILLYYFIHANMQPCK